jgi:hypothetical protein
MAFVMRRFLLGLGLLMCLLPPAAAAQQWTGTAALSVTGGHQTNTYLDPVLRSWDLLSDPSFAAVTPQVGFVRDARQTRLRLAARTRVYPRRPNVPQFAQGYAQFQYTVSPAWTVGGTGGGTRHRFESARNSGWLLPSVQWAPTSQSTLTLRGGLTTRLRAPTRSTSTRQTSGLLSVHGGTWLTDRLHASGRLYWSSGRTRTSDLQFGGTGISVQGTYWLTSQWSLQAEAAAEQLRYETAPSSSAHDRLGRVGIKAQWRVHPAATLFAQTRASAGRLARTDAMDTDVHVSVRLQTQRVLSGGPPPAPSPQRVCTSTDDGARLRIAYEGAGTPHITGDFNGWTLPGRPLTSSSGDTWTTTLSVPSGQYAYRIRIVDGDQRRWLDLPSYAQTASDAFGGTNGVCTVQ